MSLFFTVLATLLVVVFVVLFVIEIKDAEQEQKRVEAYRQHVQKEVETIANNKKLIKILKEERAKPNKRLRVELVSGEMVRGNIKKPTIENYPVDHVKDSYIKVCEEIAFLEKHKRFYADNGKCVFFHAIRSYEIEDVPNV